MTCMSGHLEPYKSVRRGLVKVLSVKDGRCNGGVAFLSLGVTLGFPRPGSASDDRSVTVMLAGSNCLQSHHGVQSTKVQCTEE